MSEHADHHNLGSLEWLGYISVTEICCHLDLPKWQVCSKAAEFLVLLSVACRKLQTHLLHSQQSLFVTTLLEKLQSLYIGLMMTGKSVAVVQEM